MLCATASKDLRRRKLLFHQDDIKSLSSMRLIGIPAVEILANSQYDPRSPTSSPSNHGDLRKHNPFRPSLQPIQQDHRGNPITLCNSTLFPPYRSTTPDPPPPNLRSRD